MERTEELALSQPQESGRPGAARRPASPLVDPSLAPFLAKSPTLRAGLAQAERDDLEVIWGQAGEGTYLVPGEKIVIDENAIGQGARIARSLSHEVGHHLFTEPSDPTSKQSYVNNKLRGEAAATLSNVQVQREIIAAGGPNIGVSGTGNRPQQYGAIAVELQAGRINRNQALSQIADVFKTEAPSVGPHATYELYYGAHYDQHIAPTQRRRRPEPEFDAERTALADRAGTATDDVSSLHRAPKSAVELGDADRSLYSQIRAGVERLDAESGKQWDESSQRLSASLLVLAKEKGLSRVDHVVLNNPTQSLSRGEVVFVVQGEMADPTRRLADMRTMDALRAPEADSLQRADALSQSQAASLLQQPAQQVPTQDGPSFSR
ncbi:XVIPCD domain-containing protein [Stenotrophomonas maltophilia]|uniref:XVIPCD domain-containing protein n=1 Tax=Stenotrophomonas maltophilia TaxID=40324 RepID=UPI0009C1A11B|nr:XVIPCD domain-containing protein [Stenotrophomonas maltophilia]